MRAAGGPEAAAAEKAGKTLDLVEFARHLQEGALGKDAEAKKLVANTSKMIEKLDVIAGAVAKDALGGAVNIAVAG